ncbi:MAG: hypothetical protein ACM3OF_06395 [Gemmatimonas sp.]|jgi:hypothetical protein
MNRADELRRLSQADRTIAGAETAIMEQIADFDKQQVDGHDTALAERSLRAFANSLSAIRDHRKLVARTIQQMDRGLI